MLNTIRHGAPGAGPPLLIAHGLFGSARNWGAVARRLAADREVVAVDMRNHGQSDWRDSHAYPDLAADLAEVIDDLGGTADVLGHSMGGKAAMALALDAPRAVRRLVVADIAPVPYDHGQMEYIRAMQAVDLSAVEKRSDVTKQLARHVDDPVLQGFFTQALDLKARAWTLNLDVLEAEMPKILGWPEIDGRFDGPALFLAGGDSDYVTASERPAIRALFPKARFAKIPGAGHWLHAQKPEAFADTVSAFLALDEDS